MCPPTASLLLTLAPLFPYKRNNNQHLRHPEPGTAPWEVAVASGTRSQELPPGKETVASEYIFFNNFGKSLGKLFDGGASCLPQLSGRPEGHQLNIQLSLAVGKDRETVVQLSTRTDSCPAVTKDRKTVVQLSRRTERQLSSCQRGERDNCPAVNEDRETVVQLSMRTEKDSSFCQHRDRRQL